MIVIVDYGNCEVMIVFVFKGLYIVYMINFVFVILVNGFEGVMLKVGCLVDFVLSLLDLMGLFQFEEMIGESFIQ